MYYSTFNAYYKIPGFTRSYSCVDFEREREIDILFVGNMCLNSFSFVITFGSCKCKERTKIKDMAGATVSLN